MTPADKPTKKLTSDAAAAKLREYGKLVDGWETRGVVNFDEGRGIVRGLERILGDPDLRPYHGAASAFREILREYRVSLEIVPASRPIRSELPSASPPRPEPYSPPPNSTLPPLTPLYSPNRPSSAPLPGSSRTASLSHRVATPPTSAYRPSLERPDPTVPRSPEPGPLSRSETLTPVGKVYGPNYSGMKDGSRVESLAIGAVVSVVEAGPAIRRDSAIANRYGYGTANLFARGGSIRAYPSRPVARHVMIPHAKWSIAM